MASITVPTSPEGAYQPPAVDQYPNVTAALGAYAEWRQSEGFQDRREEEWPTTTIRSKEEDDRFFKQTLSPAEVKKRETERNDLRKEADRPSTELERAAGRDDIRRLTEKEALNYLIEVEMTNPDPPKRKRK